MMTAVNQATKRLGVVLGIFLALLVAACIAIPASAFAAAGDTTYTVRLYGGNRGTVNGQEMAQWTGVAYGGTVDLGQAAIKVTDDKYYAKGARLAGLDNVKDVEYVAIADINGKLTGGVTVTEDADYVIAYGIMADRVEYTVQCVDASGARIAEPLTFWGDIGDIPAVRAPYIDGYVPNAYAATLPLQADADKNVVTFTYSRLAAGYTTSQNPNGTINVTTPQGSTVTVTGIPATATADATGEVIAPDGEVIPTEDGTPLAVPIDSMSIGDEEAPLASADEIGETNAQAFALNNWVSVALVVGAIALLIVAFVLWRRNRQKDSAAE